MTTPLMLAYVRRLIQICHRRGTFAMGGMSASIPVKNDPRANEASIQKVRNDKIREVQAGHDGTWVAHPALVKVARDVFDEHMTTPNQIHIKGDQTFVPATELLRLPSVPKQEAITSWGLQAGIRIVLAYTEAWIRGIGCIPLNNAMEDAATAEISRAQVWQWRVRGIKTADDGLLVSSDRISSLIQDEIAPRKGEGRWMLAGKLVDDMLNAAELDDFLTTFAIRTSSASRQINRSFRTTGDGQENLGNARKVLKSSQSTRKYKSDEQTLHSSE
eukprot:CAMPEP_0198130704 /NCGR_PEP_ID=MMETSP1442-20131203/54531_1 /TAXON_ID= /ORGANISM="Craspedostauros australis, Strain CCMP3328" /LENGTH=273 /DNA_ID=CAMNT_0043791379 /DNA_START=61 /DNA_END=883 /DNA_ORIENTATION=-